MDKQKIILLALFLSAVLTLSFADESKKEKGIYNIAKNRAEKHALNSLALLKGKTELTKFAGTGRRQGKDDEGPVKTKG